MLVLEAALVMAVPAVSDCPFFIFSWRFAWLAVLWVVAQKLSCDPGEV